MSNFMPKEAQKDLIVALKRLAEFEFKMGQATAHLRNNREECVQRLKQRIGDNLGQNIAFLRNSPATGGGKKRTGKSLGGEDVPNSFCDFILFSLKLCQAKCP